MTTLQIVKAVQEILRLMADYTGVASHTREMLLDPVVYAYFDARFGHFQRQYHVRLHGKARPKRIDFRYGTSNPVVMEIAARPPAGRSELYGNSNRDELNKLTRVVTSQARKRVLLLIDRAPRPIRAENLKPSYDQIVTTRGRFARHSVRVIYVHPDLSYNFLWRPT